VVSYIFYFATEPKMANREKLKKRISLGLSLAQVMVQASLVYLAYKQYKLSRDY